MRTKTLRIYALNVTVHPHEEGPALYTTLFERAARHRIAGKLRGNRFGMLASFSKRLTSGKNDLFTGTICTYVDFDKDAPWLNTKTGEQATETEVASVQLPADLHPELKQMLFGFIPQKHLFFYEGNTSPDGIAKMLEAILNNKAVKNLPDRQGKPLRAAVTVIQDAEKLNDILKNPNLRKLSIEIRRPNPDDLDDLDAEIEKKLSEMGAEKLTYTLDSIPGDRLVPDDDTKKLAKLALSHGGVKGTTKAPSGKTKTISTREHARFHDQKLGKGEVDEHGFVTGVLEYLKLLLL